jgi:hypothetical protein
MPPSSHSPLPRSHPQPGRALALAGAFLVAFSWGCQGSDPEAGPGGGPLPDTSGAEAPPPAPSPEGAAPVAGAEHLRVLAFVGLPADTVTVAPWHFRATVTPEGIRREREVALGRAGEWELLVADTVLTPLSRFPWRVLPGGPVEMVVGPEDALQLLAFHAPPRTMTLLPDAFLAEWVPGPGAAWRLHRARLELPAGEVDGLLLDLNRSRGPGGAAEMDWFFLHGGTGAQLLLKEPEGPRPAPADEIGEEGAAPTPPRPWLGWSRVAFQEREWTGLAVTVSELRAVDAARREVPSAWTLAGEGIEGELRVVRSLLQVGEGPGPVLPVAGYLEVEGEVRILGERIPVRGLSRHRQP